MKKIFNYSVLLLCSLVLGLTGCKKQELVFDYEKLHFETKADAILLEVTVPAGTGANDAIYILGAFNGNKISPEYKLTKHPETNFKFGIYLYADEFVDGATLANGFHFENAVLGQEKYEKEHVIDGAVAGARYEISFSNWNTAVKPIVPGEYEHLYVLGNVVGTDWDPAAPLEMEMVGTDIFRAELSFPNENNWFAFCTEKGDWDIVNANRWGAGDALLSADEVVNLENGEQCVTLPQGTYVVTVNMAKKIAYLGEEEPAAGEKFPTFEHDGDAIYVCNMAGWDEVALYAWSETSPELFGGWPGAQPTEKFQFKGYDWYLFDCGEENAGLFYHFIANNNGGGKQVEPLVEYELTTDGIKYILISADLKAEEIEDPNTYEFPDPTPKPEPETVWIDIYVYDATTAAFTMEGGEETPASFYAWGSSEIFGGWPGMLLSEWEDVTILGMPLKKFSIECEEGSNYNLILNNKATSGNQQYDAFAVTAEGELTEVYYKLTDTEATPLQVTPLAPRRK